MGSNAHKNDTCFAINIGHWRFQAKLLLLFYFFNLSKSKNCNCADIVLNNPVEYSKYSNFRSSQSE